jgi:hypothetical protein
VSIAPAETLPFLPVDWQADALCAERTTAETSLTILEAALTVDALPKPAKDREAMDRDELKMLLDSADDPVGVAMRLVGSGDADAHLVAVLTGSYGKELSPGPRHGSRHPQPTAADRGPQRR